MAAWRSETYAHSEKAGRTWLRRSFWFACALLLIPSGFSKEGMDRNARIDVIRGLLREVAVTKVPLPYGKKGVRVDAQGKLDQAAALSEMHSNGMAMKAGTPAEITKIEFKSNQVTFELNGGGSPRRSGTSTSRLAWGGRRIRWVHNNKRSPPSGRRSRWTLARPFLTLPSLS